MNRKGFSQTIIFFTVVGLLLIGAAGYVIFTAKTPPAPVSSATIAQQASTTDWKTYRSDEYKFEFMYPPAWTVKHWKGDRIFFVCNEKLATSCGPLPEGVIASFTITVMDNKEGLGLEQYVGSPVNDAKVVEITTLGGEKALITVPRKLTAGTYPGEYLWVAKNELVFKLLAGFESKEDIYGKFCEILSTFKFT